jgi:DNA-binding HxlR family transcriptional regulator
MIDLANHAESNFVSIVTSTADSKLGECPVETTLAVIGGKWKPLILWHLGESGVRRFLELHRIISGITRKMLTQHLRELERDGIVARKIFNELPPHVEYSLTKYGQTLRPLLRALCDWGSKHEAYMAKNGAHLMPKPAPISSTKPLAVAIG